MQFYYGESNILRALDEAEFWKHQEIEHTDVVRLATPGLEENYVEQMISYKAAASKTRGFLVRYVQSAVRSGGNVSADIKEDMEKLVMHCARQSEKFVAILTDMLKNSAAVNGNTASQTVINHIIREAQYFIGIVELVLH